MWVPLVCQEQSSYRHSPRDGVIDAQEMHRQTVMWYGRNVCRSLTHFRPSGANRGGMPGLLGPAQDSRQGVSVLIVHPDARLRRKGANMRSMQDLEAHRPFIIRVPSETLARSLRRQLTHAAT